jgi:tol-pal system protein YbgF
MITTTFRHLPWLFLVVGCASPMTALREDNRRLTASVSELRIDRRAQDRKLRDLEHELDEARAKLAMGAIDNAPALPVVVAMPAQSPSGERVVGIADDGSEIVYEGDAALGKKAPLPLIQISAPHHEPVAMDDVPTSPDRIEVTHHARRSSVRTHEPAVDRDGDAGADYRAAVELVKSGKQEEAVAALHAFLVKYPRHDYADNAQYWLGESFYAQKDFAHALAEFRTVIETYPRGNKVPDALLKVGYCYQALGQTDKAHAVLAQVVNLYPKSEPAALAAKRLETP